MKTNSESVAYAKAAKADNAADGADCIEWVQVSYINVPFVTPVSDAKVLTGRQKPLTGVGLVFAQIRSREGYEGIGFGYALRVGATGMYELAKELAPLLLEEDPNDISKIFSKLVWTSASMGRSGLTTQAIAPFDIALWDLKAKRAKLPLAKLLGAQRVAVPCYNSSGGYLHTPLAQVLKNVEISRQNGIGGIKLKVGQPDVAADLKRVAEVRKLLGPDFPLMLDANQQWDRITAQRVGRRLEEFNLTWLEEPLDAHDVEGHAALTALLDTPIATGEMLTSLDEHRQFIEQEASDFVQPDAPRIGGITPFLQIMTLAELKKRKLAPHFAMEIHLQLAAAYPGETWVEHFEWLNPVFNEQLEIREGKMWIPNRPGLGLTLSEQALAWTVAKTAFGKRP